MTIVFYGDSNTYGYSPDGGRYEERFTNILKSQYGLKHDIYNEGIVGRTTIYDDDRPNRKGITNIRDIILNYEDIDILVIMLGTNDYKKVNARSEKDLAFGMISLLEKLPKIKQILIISPIHLAKNIKDLDSDFDDYSYELSLRAAKIYKKIAHDNNYLFLDASQYANPGIDGEHLDEDGHEALAEAIAKILNL